MEPGLPADSGWCFLSGEETSDYIANSGNLGLYSINTVCNYDPAIIPYLDAPIGAHFLRVPSTDQFQPIPGEETDRSNLSDSALP